MILTQFGLDGVGIGRILRLGRAMRRGLALLTLALGRLIEPSDSRRAAAAAALKVATHRGCAAGARGKRVRLVDMAETLKKVSRRRYTFTIINLLKLLFAIFALASAGLVT